MIAIIRNIRPGATVTGSHICTVECPNCQDSRTLTYGGWSAIVCGSCKATLHRSKASQNAPSAAESRQQAHQAFHDFASGLTDKWEMYSIVFGLMDSRRLTLSEIKSIGPRYGVTAGAIQMRRCDWLNERSIESANA